MEYSYTKETNNISEKTDMNFNLPNTIKNIVFYYIRAHYNKYLQNNNLKLISSNELPKIIKSLISIV